MSHPCCVYINNRCGYQSITQQYLDIVVLLTDTHTYCLLFPLLLNTKQPTQYYENRKISGTILVIFHMLQHYQNFIRYSWPWCAVSQSQLTLTFNWDLRSFNNRFYILHSSDSSRQAYSRSAGQNIPRLLLRFKVYYRLFVNSVPVVSMFIPSSYIPYVF